ncbi:MAG: type III pantothenate kinase [Oscillospiraceae bacterium]|nr:type III pantothenate kinase [Oscillospiraceae bacterium]
MLFAVDAGNTYIVVGGLVEGAVRFTATLATDQNKTADEYAILLENLMDIRRVDRGAIVGAIISCVVPSLTGRLREAISQVTGSSPLVVGPGVKTGLNILLDNPNQMGSDLVSNAVAAAANYKLPCVTVDMGTATILGVLDQRGNYIGGALYPGLQLSLAALAAGTSQLPNVELIPPDRVIGRSTVECMQSGILYGFAAMLDGMLDRIERELGEAPTVIFTGEYAALIAKLCRRADIICDPHLILKGLWLIYQKNTKK